MFSGETIDGNLLGEWLEDSGRFSRYATDPEDSVWICTDCERIEDNCECGDDATPYDY